MGIDRHLDLQYIFSTNCVGKKDHEGALKKYQRIAFIWRVE